MPLCGLLGLLHHTDRVLRSVTAVGPSRTSSLLHLQSACLSTCDLGDFLRHGGWGRFSIVLVTFVFTQLRHTSWRPFQMHRLPATGAVSPFLLIAPKPTKPSLGTYCEPGETFLTVSKNRTDEKRERREGRWAIITAGLKKQVELGQSSR
jgi:hypothetical protein